jgi:hypothetical protein
MNYLPNEILAIILNEVVSDDKDNDKTLAALASCRLASHVLCSLATPHFFSSIRLTDTIGEGDCSLFVKRATKLNEILTVQNIADSVHTLTLYGRPQTLKDPTSGALMSTILRRLPHIRSFALEAHNYCSKFSSFREEFASAIRALCRSPNLMTLYLNGIQGFPFTAVMGCPNLRSLRLRNVTTFKVNFIFPALFRNDSVYFSSTTYTRYQARSC